MSCFYANAGSTDQKGPCDLDHLIHLYKIKEINEDTLLWTEGMLNWEPMKSCKIGNFVMQPEKFDDYDVDNDDEEDSDEEGGDDQSLGASVKSGATLETMDTAEYDGAENLKIDFFLGPPPPLSGILSKMASGMIKNWKKRHFVLEKGSMMYYEPVHLKLRGRYNLLGLGIVSGHLTDSPETIRLHSATRPDICLTAATPRQRKRWANALQQHIQYANYLSDVKKGLVSAAPALSSSGSSGSAKNGESSSSFSEPRRSMRKLTIIEVSEDGNSAAPATSLRHSTVVTPASAAAVPNEGVMASAVAIRRTSSGPDVLRRSMTASPGPQVVEAELCLRNTTLISGNDNTYTNIARPATGYNAPPLCEGWLSKQGQLFPSIRRRYFILDKGVIRYYRTNISDTTDKRNNTVYAHTPLGVLTLAHYSVASDTSDAIQIILTPSDQSHSRRRLVLYCDNFVERDMWMAAVTAHIAYRPTKVT